MGFFSRNKNSGETWQGQGAERSGMIDVIKYEAEDEVLIWRYPYKDISWGAQLIVGPDQEAVFISKGVVCDVFGPGTVTLESKNIPILEKLLNIPFGGNTPITAEVLFVSTRHHRTLHFGTPTPIEIQDTIFDQEVSVPVRSYGEFGIKIVDPVKFVTKLAGTSGDSTDESIREKMVSDVIKYLKGSISKQIVIHQVNILKINALIVELSDYMEKVLKEKWEEYGMEVTNFNIVDVSYDKNDPNVRRALDAQSEEARLRKLGTNYQQERQFDIMEGAANNEGMAGNMMGAGMGLGMGVGVGGAMGSQMSGIANVMNAGAPNPLSANSSATPPPPPPPSVVYHVLINGQQQGPFDLNVIASKIAISEIRRDTLVWKPGMANWQAAGECGDLSTLFAAVPPPPPSI